MRKSDISAHLAEEPSFSKADARDCLDRGVRVSLHHPAPQSTDLRNHVRLDRADSQMTAR